MVPLSQDHICLHVRANANYENSNLHIYQRPNFRYVQYSLLLPPQDNNVWQFTRKHYILLKIYDCNQDITNGEMSIRQNVNDYFLMKELHQVYKKENSEESGRWKKSLWFFKYVANLFHFCVYSITRKQHQKFTLMLDLQL